MQRIILFLLSALISLFSWAQQTIHSHVVDDETGEAIPYATVYVHSGLGTLTNSDGDFTISCPTDGTVQITCIGYTRQSFPVTSVPKLIRLQPLSTTLKEVNIIPTDNNITVSDALAQAQMDTMSYASIVQPLQANMGLYWGPAESMGKEIVAGAVTHDNAAEKTETMNTSMNTSAVQ